MCFYNRTGLAATLCLLFPFATVANQSKKPASLKRIEFIQKFHPKAQGPLIEMWIPTPTEDATYQKVLSREFSGNTTIVRLEKESEYSAPMIYARWENVTNPSLQIKNLVEVSERNGVTLTASDVSKYLQPTDHVQTDGIVSTTAQKITKGIKDPDKKARAIYDWIIDNTFRNPEVRGCGFGDVKSLLHVGDLSGKCADLNSLFVGLARASGLPAREVWGIRVAPSEYSKALGKAGDVSKAQHCRAEYYSKKLKGWVPVDPADIRKVILEENLKVSDARVKELRNKFFGFWENNWVSFNWARDFEITGYDKKINYFMYPLLLAAQTKPDGMDPAETGYVFQSTVIHN